MDLESTAKLNSTKLVELNHAHGKDAGHESSISSCMSRSVRVDNGNRASAAQKQ